MGKKKDDDMDQFKKLLDQVVVPKTPLGTPNTLLPKATAKPSTPLPQWKINQLKLESLKKAHKAKVENFKKQQLQMQKMVTSLTKINAAMKTSLPLKCGASTKSNKGFSR